MKAKTVSSSTKKARPAANKKAVSASKARPASAAKKMKPASSPKPASLAQQKQELHEEVLAFATAAFKRNRIAYFVHDTERKEGAYIMCIAVEGEPGFYKMDWGWHCSFSKARTETSLMNKKLGLNEEQVNEIIISTMGPQVPQKKKRKL